MKLIDQLILNKIIKIVATMGEGWPSGKMLKIAMPEVVSSKNFKSWSGQK